MIVMLFLGRYKFSPYLVIFRIGSVRVFFFKPSLFLFIINSFSILGEKLSLTQLVITCRILLQRQGVERGVGRWGVATYP